MFKAFVIIAMTLFPISIYSQPRDYCEDCENRSVFANSSVCNEGKVQQWTVLTYNNQGFAQEKTVFNCDKNVNHYHWNENLSAWELKETVEMYSNTAFNSDEFLFKTDDNINSNSSNWELKALTETNDINYIVYEWNGRIMIKENNIPEKYVFDQSFYSIPHIKIASHPIDKLLNIEFDTRAYTKGTANIVIYDSKTGNVVNTKANVNLTDNKYKVDVDVSMLPEGSYTVNALSAEYSCGFPFQITR